MTTNEKALQLHKQWNGKIETVSKTPVKTREDLALAYTPGVAEPCKVIAEDKEAAYQYTMKANTVAVISDGSAVLGLGNIGPYAAMPVMEGKAVLFKEFGGVNAVPICLDTQDTEEIIKTVAFLAPGFGGINLEDISAPRCFEIEERLKQMLDIPVFHDDQHGTAIVVLAGIINALKVTAAHLRLSRHHYVRQDRYCFQENRRPKLDAAKDDGSYQSAKYDRHACRRHEGRRHLCGRLRA